jgi:GAF domain-containing protein
MTNEQRRRIEYLCRQIEVVQDETILVQLVFELHELIKQWLCDVRHPLQTESKPNGNGRHVHKPITGASNYEMIVDAAVTLMRADYASLQKLYPERGIGGELRLLAFRGFNPHSAAFWEWVRADSKTTCGMALRRHQRVVAPDIASCEFMVDSEDQRVFLQNGIHAGQSTPLIARSGKVVGMISTHWRTPHQPSQEDFRLLDVLAREAAEVI